jgi:Arc/MetJ family transcription regulator
MIDQELLREANKLLGEKTFSETVNHSLREMIRILKAKKITSLVGKVKWEGDLDEMRGRKGKSR